MTQYQTSQAAVFALTALGTAFASDSKCSTGAKIDLWLSEIFEHIIPTLLPVTSASHDAVSVQNILYFLWSVLRKNEVTDLQQGVIDLNILSILESTVFDVFEEKSIENIALGVAVLRRVVTLDSLKTIDKILLERINSWTKLAEKSGGENVYKRFLAKELMSCIGNVIAYKESVLVESLKEHTKNPFYLGNNIITKLCTDYLDIPKVVKTGLVSLNNLTTYEGNHVDPNTSYDLIDHLIKTHSNSLLIVEASLKLLLSLCSKGKSMLEALASKGAKELALASFKVKSAEVHVISIKILRVIYGRHNEKWMSDKAETNKVVMEVLKQPEDKACVEFCCEALLLLAVLLDSKSKEDSERASVLIKDLMTHYKDKEADLNKIIECISHLPIEDILPS